MINNKKYLFVLLFTTCCGLLSAQNNASNSPYSRYGLGLLADQSQGFNKGMGGVAYGMRGSKTLNFQNPASYSALDSLMLLFDVGVSLQNDNLKVNGLKKNAKNSSIDYISVGFRAWRKVGMSIGLMPYSTVGYSFSSSSTLDDIDGYGSKTSTTTYSGNGGLHQAYFGVGWEPIKNLSIGGNASYLWGDYSHTTQASFSESSILTLTRNYSATISTYKLDFGMQYAFQLNKKNQIILGATYGLGHDIGAHASFINRKLSSSTTVSADTLSAGGAFGIPSTFGAGIAWKYLDRLTLGFDVTGQLWGNVRFPQLTETNGVLTYAASKDALKDSYKFSFGGEYIPNPTSPRYLGHIRYRAGVTYTTPYVKINGKDGAKSLRVSAGVALPIMNTYSSRSILNVSAQWERLSPSYSNAITENYLRLCIGLTFSEGWFSKWKLK